jgi:hypothetical protein
MSKLVQEVCNYFEIKKINTAPYIPKCDGLVERFNRTLSKMLAVYCDANQANWNLYLPLVLFAYRTSKQATTEISPFELLYGREPRLPSDLDSFKRYESSKLMDDINYGWIEAKRKILKQAFKISQMQNPFLLISGNRKNFFHPRTSLINSLYIVTIETFIYQSCIP